jgi:hypothetical protein
MATQGATVSKQDWISLFILLDFMLDQSKFRQLSEYVLDNHDIGIGIGIDSLPQHLRRKVFLFADWDRIPRDLKWDPILVDEYNLIHEQSLDE